MASRRRQENISCVYPPEEQIYMDEGVWSASMIHKNIKKLHFGPTWRVDAEIFTSFTGRAASLEALHIENCTHEILDSHLINLVKEHPKLRELTLQGATSITDKGLIKVFDLWLIDRVQITGNGRRDGNIVGDFAPYLMSKPNNAPGISQLHLEKQPLVWHHLRSLMKRHPDLTIVEGHPLTMQDAQARGHPELAGRMVRRRWEANKLRLGQSLDMSDWVEELERDEFTGLPILASMSLPPLKSSLKRTRGEEEGERASSSKTAKTSAAKGTKDEYSSPVEYVQGESSKENDVQRMMAELEERSDTEESSQAGEAEESSQTSETEEELGDDDYPKEETLDFNDAKDFEKRWPKEQLRTNVGTLNFDQDFQLADTHLDAIAHAPSEFWNGIHSFHCANASHLADDAISTLSSALPKLEYVGLQGATLLTDTTVIAILKNCQRVYWISISGEEKCIVSGKEKTLGPIGGDALTAALEDRTMGKKLRSLFLLRQSISSDTAKALSKTRKKLEICIGSNASPQSWQCGKIVELDLEEPDWLKELKDEYPDDDDDDYDYGGGYGGGLADWYEMNGISAADDYGREYGGYGAGGGRDFGE